MLPVLQMRKEEFVTPEHPLQEKFTWRTAQEERHGLYVSPERIGTRNGWEQVLQEQGVSLRGHRVVNTRQ